MPSTVEKLSPSRVKLTVEIPFADLKPHLDKAYSEIAKSVTIPGFRKGKVPSVVIDQRFGRGAVLQEAINAALPAAFEAAVVEAKLVPLGEPDVEVTRLEDGELMIDESAEGEADEDEGSPAELQEAAQAIDFVTLPIACVEGWSAQGTWSGVRMADLLRAVGAPTGRDVDVTSLQQSGAFRRTTLPANFADDEQTLLVLDLAGEPLSLDHGFPCRLIAPNRPGVLQTKWVSRLEVTA